MSLKEQIFEDLKNAMKSHEADKITVLRGLNSAIKDKEIQLNKRNDGLNEDEIKSVITKEAKKRKDAILEYQKGKREELAEKEKQELKILQNYIPKELSEEEIIKEVNKIIEELKPINAQDFGRIMQATMNKLKGRADGAIVNKILKEKLNN